MAKKKGSHGLKHYTTPWKVQKQGKGEGRTMPLDADGELFSLTKRYRVEGRGEVAVSWVNPPRDDLPWMAVITRQTAVPVSELITIGDIGD